MVTSLTDLANLALSEIGARLISSLDEDTTEARVCRLHFNPTRDALLRQHVWSFATRRAALSKLTAVPKGDWDSAWEMPADCVRVQRLSSGVPNLNADNFTIEGRTILTRGQGAVVLVYISNTVPVGEWDSLFIEAFTYLLAAKIAGPITQSPGLASDMLNKFKQLALADARTADAREVREGESFGFAQVRLKSSLWRSRWTF